MSDEIPVKWQRVIAAADGYVDLGMASHARKEMEELPSELNDHHSVTWVRYRVAYLEEQWEEAMVIADGLRLTSPVKEAAWISMAVACRRARGLEEAIMVLEEGLPLFPANALFPYNLACYHCLLGREDKARALLRAALAMEPAMQEIAIWDEDLESLREEIKLRVFLPEKNEAEDV